MKKLDVTKKDRDFLTKEYCLGENRALEPIDSFDIQPGNMSNLYIPSSDILFLREVDNKKNAFRIVAYNIEFGIWTHSEWSEGEKMAQELQMDAFRSNIENMFEKIIYAIEKKSFDSIFCDGEEFQPTLRGINTKLQTCKEHLLFRSKFENSTFPSIFSDKEQMKEYKKTFAQIKETISR